MASDALSALYTLAMAVKAAHEGVQGNQEQCTLLNDQVQNVVSALRGLPPPTLKKAAVKAAVSSLRETLRAAADLIEGFKKKHWIKKMLSHSSTTEKFEALFVELDRVLAVCGFALNVREVARIFIFVLLSFFDILSPSSALLHTPFAFVYLLHLHLSSASTPIPLIHTPTAFFCSFFLLFSSSSSRPSLLHLPPPLIAFVAIHRCARTSFEAEVRVGVL